MASIYQRRGEQREFLEQNFRTFWEECDTKEAKEAADKAALEAQKAAQAAALEEEKAAEMAALAAQKTAIEAENQYWGFAHESPESLKGKDQLPENIFRFEDAVKQPWCSAFYVNQTWLIKFLDQYGYPKRILACGLLTQIGFDILLGAKLEKERGRDNERKQNCRKRLRASRQPPEPNDTPLAAAKELSEPKDTHLPSAKPLLKPKETPLHDTSKGPPRKIFKKNRADI